MMEAQIKKNLAEITGTSKVEDAIAGLLPPADLIYFFFIEPLIKNVDPVLFNKEEINYNNTSDVQVEKKLRAEVSLPVRIKIEVLEFSEKFGVDGIHLDNGQT